MRQEQANLSTHSHPYQQMEQALTVLGSAALADTWASEQEVIDFVRARLQQKLLPSLPLHYFVS